MARGTTTTRAIPRYMGGSTFFNKTNAYVYVTTPSILDFRTSFTLSAWIFPMKESGTSDNELAICSKARPASSTYKYTMFLGTDNTLKCAIYNGSSNPIITSTDKNIVNCWQHVVATYDNTNITLYRNGVRVGQGAASVDIEAISSNFEIGRRAGASDRRFYGKIADVRAYATAMTDAQVLQHYKKGIDPITAVATWKLDDLPSTYIDSVGGNNGTGSNTAYSPDTPLQQRKTVDEASKAGLKFDGQDTDRIEVATLPNLSVLTNPGDEINATTVVKLGKGILGSSNSFFRIAGGLTFGRQGTNNMDSYCYVNASGDYAGTRRLRCTHSYANLIKLLQVKWNTITIRYFINSTNNLRSQLWVNGQKCEESGVDYTDDTNTPTAPLFIGNYSTGSSSINGNIKAVWIHNGALTDAQRRALHFDKIAPRENLVLELLMNEGSGSTVYDTSGYGNNGTITGATWTAETPTAKRKTIGSNMISNDLSYHPASFVAAHTTSLRWLDGTAAGSTSKLPVRIYVSFGGDAGDKYVRAIEKDGRKSMMAHINAGAYTEIRIGSTNYYTFPTNQDFLIEPSTQYKLSCWMKSENVSGTSDSGQYVSLLLSKYSGASSEAKNLTTIKVDKDWTYYEATFTTNSESRAGHAELRAYGHTGASTLAGDFYFSDLRLVKVSPNRSIVV